jgi:3-dehydroquinate dehydratase-2
MVQDEAPEAGHTALSIATAPHRRRAAHDSRPNDQQLLCTKASPMSKPILIINGPNLNKLGTREPHIYGSTTLADVEAMCRERARELGHEISFHQSNSEAQIIDWIHGAIDDAAGIIINPAAFTHTSVAILDALKMVPGPIIELHISNPHTREAFRHHSYVTLAATGMICGIGVKGYVLAVEAMASLLEAQGA